MEKKLIKIMPLDRIIAVIPARGGSKGILRKNLRLLGGKPLLVYSIEQARRTSGIHRVIVSTDDAEIGEIAQKHGAEVVRRPADISGDSASSESALIHVLDQLQEREGYEPELVVFLQATSPLRRPDDIRKAIETFQQEQADSLFSACPVPGFVWRRQGTRLTSLTYDYRQRQRRQELAEDLMENGSIYVFKPWVLRQFNNRLGGKIRVYRMDVLDSFQVDEPGDLKLMEKMLLLERPSMNTPPLDKIKLLVLDFDGVMTDNRVLVDQNGTEAVWCNRADGWGIARLKEAGIEAVVLSTETNSVVASRCQKLHIPCVHGSEDKLAALRDLVQQRGLSPEEVAYLGNDVNDLKAMAWVGLPIAVADSHPTVLALSRLVTSRVGGQGAVREVAEWILEVKSR